MMHLLQLSLTIKSVWFLLRIEGWLIIVLIGAIVGFLSGLLGKGGSAITTPALQLFAGISPFIALASPLPATLPTTISASFAYKGRGLIDFKVVSKSILFGIPATLIGSYYTDWFNGGMIMLLTAIFVMSLGASFFLFSTPKEVPENSIIPSWKIIVIALGIGFLSGLLANSGGVLFGPLFIRVLKMPTKKALASSLIVAAGLAIPGTIAHWYLGHIDWQLVFLLSISSIPCSYLGAKLAIVTNSRVLEFVFACMLIAFGLVDIVYSLSHLKI